MNIEPTSHAPNSSATSTEQLTHEERQVVERVKRNAKPSRNQSLTRWMLSVHCGFGGW
jgi:hypothetical protein